MNEKQLTDLLTEASNLKPSPALRARIADLKPRPRPMPWLVLSAATAALAVAAVTLLPRPSYAEGLLDRAAQNSANTSAHFISYAFTNGAWQVERRGIIAPGWTRFDAPNGGFQLDTPSGHFERVTSAAPVLQTQAHPPMKDGLTLDKHLRFLRQLGRTLSVSLRDDRDADGKPVRNLIIDMGERQERETVTLDSKAELPLRILSEVHLKNGWLPQARVDITYPGPVAGDGEFWAGIDRSKVVNGETLTALWSRRLSPVLQTLRLSGGKALQVRDLRTLPSGDVLMLYTGPSNFEAKLVGEDGTRFVRVWFDPNDGRSRPHNRPPVMIEGEPLRGFWFTPKESGARAGGRVRLEITGGPAPEEAEKSFPGILPGDAVGAHGVFSLSPVAETAAAPGWAEAIDFGPFLTVGGEGQREEARLIAAFDGWLDAKGTHVDGTYSLRPEIGVWAAVAPPRAGLRRDPKSAAAAATIFRQMMEQARIKGREINPALVEGWLGRFEREARGETQP